MRIMLFLQLLRNVQILQYISLFYEYIYANYAPQLFNLWPCMGKASCSSDINRLWKELIDKSPSDALLAGLIPPLFGSGRGATRRVAQYDPTRRRSGRGIVPCVKSPVVGPAPMVASRCTAFFAPGPPRAATARGSRRFCGERCANGKTPRSGTTYSRKIGHRCFERGEELSGPANRHKWQKSPLSFTVLSTSGINLSIMFLT